MTYALAIALGVVAGIFAGLFGVGGGILFVPTLVFLGLSQIHAEATSLSEGVLRRVFAVFMVVTAAHIAWQNRRRR